MASYTKLKSGEWGVRVEGTAKAGQSVTVRKKDGTSKQETILRVVWTGNGISLCAIAQRQPATSGRSGGYSRGYSSEYCGGICPVGGHRCSAKEGPCHDCQ